MGKSKSNKAKTYEIKQNKKSSKKKHSKLKKVILVFFILILLMILVAGGILAGVFFSDEWAITKEELISNGNTEVYDSEGNQIALLSGADGDNNRKVITLDQMGKYTAAAYVSIEDKRFYEHSGVDLIRTAKATASYILNRGSSDVGGGSTITQQLVKNIMKDKADTGAEGIQRKIREMSRAFQIERMLTKQQIIEKYLNVIFIGGSNLHGVEYGAKYYFAKSAKDLDLAESAFLAGINNAPNMYNPYDKENDHSELIKSRTKLVLSFMKEQNRISDNPEEAERLYNEAVEKVEKGFEFKKGEFEFGNTSYFVEEAIKEAAKDLAEAKDVDYEEADNMIRSGGYKLYTTQVSSIQKTVIKEMAKDQYVEKRSTNEKDEDGKTKKVTYRTNAGMTVIDHKTGKVVAMGGDLQQDQALLYTNYATSTARQTGSSIKPLANLAPGLEEKVLTAATVYYDIQTRFGGNYTPKNVGSYLGLCTVRKAIETSSNVVNLKMMSNVGVRTSIKYLHDFGLDTYVAGEDGLSLAIGGATHGSSTLQMAAAYACIANGGVYIEPTFYNKMVDGNGKTVIESKQETRRVISAANAFIIADVLTDVVTGYSGTASACAISGMDVAAKTGTTDDVDNKWLCGFTPYYAAATWYGYGNTVGWSVNNVNAAKNIWANVMKEVHKKLDKKRFTKPEGVVSAKVCKDSGKLATSECKNTYTEYFAKGTVPKACDGHTTFKVCKETGKIATEYCIDTEERAYTLKPDKELNCSWTVLGGNKSVPPTEACNVHSSQSVIIVPNVVGRSSSEASSMLVGLNVQIIYENDSNQPDGTVIRQTIAEGTKVQSGSSIVIVVNKIATEKPTIEEPKNNETQNNENTTEENVVEPADNNTVNNAQ